MTSSAESYIQLRLFRGSHPTLAVQREGATGFGLECLLERIN
jgi:hypothetical protein